MRNEFLGTVVLILAAVGPAAAAPSWGGPLVAAVEERDLPPPPGAFVGGFALDAAGAPVVFNGTAVVRWNGDDWEEVYRPSSFVYGAFVKIRGGTAYFGESSNGSITAIDLAVKTSAVVETLSYNYDMAFDADGRAFVSAPSPNSTLDAARNGFYLVDLDPETPPDLVIEIPGYSGPCAFGRDGFLYAARAASGAPVEVFRFSREAIQRGAGDGFVTEKDGEVFASNIPGAYGMVFGSFDLLFVGDAVTGQILALRDGGSPVQWSAPLAGYAAATYLDYHAPSGRLGAIASDFATFNRLVLLTTDYEFKRGTANEDEEINIADAVALLAFLFSTAPAPLNLDRVDVNDDGAVDLADAIFLLGFLFGHGEKPPEPFERPGVDPTPDELGQ
jgi:hypothetical protein